MPRYDLTKRLSPKAEVAVFSAVLVIFSFAVGSYIYDLGWYPQEEGLYLEMAEQILAGRLPHLDFEDPSVGGMDLVHALVLEVFGHSVLSARILLLVAATAAYLCALLILSRSLTIGPSFGVVLTCYLWGPPSYLVSSPPWYGALLAIIALYGLLRFSESGATRWLLLSGLLAGIACCVHLASGLLQLAAALFFLLYLDSDSDESADDRARASGAILALKISVWVVVLALLACVLTRQADPGKLVYFASGPALLALPLLVIGSRSSGGNSRFRKLLRQILTYLAAMASIVLAMLLFFLVRGGVPALNALWAESVVGSIRLCADSTGALPGWGGIVALIPLNAFLLLLYFLLKEKAPSWVVWLIIASTAAGLFWLLSDPADTNYRVTWSIFRLLLPESILVGIVLLALAGTGKIQWSVEHRRRLALCVAFASFFNLLQFPTCTGYSFLYAFPFLLLLLGVMAAPVVCGDGGATYSRWLPRAAALLWLVFAIIFSWVYLLKADAHLFAKSWAPRTYYDRLQLERAPVFADRESRRAYEGTVRVMQVCAPEPGSYAMAFPDCHALFFLSGKRNPFRSYGVPGDAQVSRWEAIMGAIKDYNVRVIVWDSESAEAKAMFRDSELMSELSRRMEVRYEYEPFVSYSMKEPWDTFEKKGEPLIKRHPVERKRWPW